MHLSSLNQTLLENVKLHPVCVAKLKYVDLPEFILENQKKKVKKYVNITSEGYGITLAVPYNLEDLVKSTSETLN